MVEETRISKLLPTIKCSNCGDTVELRKLSDHICGPTPSMPELPDFYKPQRQDPRLAPNNVLKQNNNVNQRPNLSPLSVPDKNYNNSRSQRSSPRSPRAFYDMPLSSSADSGYSSNPNYYAPQPPTQNKPTANKSAPFLDKYQAVMNKTVNSSSTSRTNSTKSTNSTRSNQTSKSSASPIENDSKDYYNKNNNYTNSNPYASDKYSNNQDSYNVKKSRDPYAQNYNNDNYRTQTSRQHNDAYDDNDDNNNKYMKNPPQNDNYGYDNSDDYSKYDRPNVNNYDYNKPQDYNSNRYPQSNSNSNSNNNNNNNNKHHHGNGKMNGSKDNYDNGFDDLMDDLMREMDNMNPSPKSERGYSKDICAHCNSKINSSPMWALGKAWHPHHLLCTSCRTPIDPNEGHVEKDGRIYCPRDYAEIFLPKCRRCGLSVEKEAVGASDGKLEGKWHIECFNCHTCYKPFPEKSFYVFNNAPYCKRHYHKLNNSLCRQCDDPIEGPCAQTIEGWRYHPRCFVCAKCATQLTDIYYSFENQQYCETHILEIQQRRKIRAEKRMTMFRNI